MFIAEKHKAVALKRYRLILIPEMASVDAKIYADTEILGEIVFRSFVVK